MTSRFGVGLAALGLVLPAPASRAVAQSGRPDSVVSADIIDSMLVRLRAAMARYDAAAPGSFKSLEDSTEWDRVRVEATTTREFRVVVSLFDRKLWVVLGSDTLLTAPAAVASGMTLDYAGQSWTFRTPRGRHQVLRKTSDPVWTPPDWAYAEVAAEHGLALARLSRGQDVPLRDGTRLTVRGSLVGVVAPGDTAFVELRLDEHIVFDGTLFIPPSGTLNRRINGELGSYALDLGDGYMIHGTPDRTSIGRAITHGCIRLDDHDIAWLYKFVREGTRVFIY